MIKYIHRRQKVDQHDYALLQRSSAPLITRALPLLHLPTLPAFIPSHTPTSPDIKTPLCCRKKP